MQSTQPHRVAMLAYDGAQILDITGPLEVFARTARWLEDNGRCDGRAYEVEIVTDQPGLVTTSSGLQLVAKRCWRDVRAVDTLLITGGIGYLTAADNAPLLEWIVRQSNIANRVGSICTGAFVLAAAGLLDGESATTHWGYCDKLSSFCPATTVEPDAIYVQSGDIYTSAGVTAGMDLALAMVEDDWGRDVALAVARELVLFLKRPGGQSQYSSFLSAQETGSDRFRNLQLWVLENLTSDLSVSALAERMAMSPRNFARAFATEAGLTPGKFVQQARLETARRMLEETDLHIDQVAWRCGYNNSETMRKAFARHLGVTPGDYRHRFQ
ncbi:MAG: GlxA family transcriptional regulator [Gammaproteobacteria bacterium]